MEKSIPCMLLLKKKKKSLTMNYRVSFSRDTELPHLENLKDHKKPKSNKSDTIEALNPLQLRQGLWSTRDVIRLLGQEEHPPDRSLMHQEPGSLHNELHPSLLQL